MLKSRGRIALLKFRIPNLTFKVLDPKSCKSGVTLILGYAPILMKIIIRVITKSVIVAIKAGRNTRRCSELCGNATSLKSLPMHAHRAVLASPVGL